MTLNLILRKETDKSRLYENRDGARLWIPRSVCPRTLKYPPEEGKDQICEVTVEDWWLQKNPWPSTGQGQLKL